MFLNLDHHHKDKIAAIDNENSPITYGELVNKISEFSDYLIERSLVFMLCKNSIGSLLGYLAFVTHGLVPVTLSANIDNSSLEELIRIYQPKYLWIPIERLSDFNSKAIYKTHNYVLIETEYYIYPIHDDLQLCMTTSGSTGSPKLVRYKKGNLEANAKNVAKAFGWTEKERAICDLGMNYTMGLNVINTHLYVGATLLLTTYNLLNDKFWEFIKKNKATNFTGVPFSYDILYRLHFEDMEIPTLKTLSQGGGKLTDSRFKQLANYADRTGKRFIASFGTTETSARMACLPPELAQLKVGSIGKAIPEGELYLIDSAGNEILEQIADGEMCYKGPNVTMGYAICKEDLMKDDEFCGVYHTGDLAHRDADGYYYIIGRKARFLKLLSYRVSLDESERLIQQEFGIECACTGTDKRMDIYILNEEYKEDVLNYISSKTNIYKSMFAVKITKNIPRNESGKILYKEISDE